MARALLGESFNNSFDQRRLAPKSGSCMASQTRTSRASMRRLLSGAEDRNCCISRIRCAGLDCTACEYSDSPLTPEFCGHAAAATKSHNTNAAVPEKLQPLLGA